MTDKNEEKEKEGTEQEVQREESALNETRKEDSQEESEKLKEKIKILEDRYLRLLADFQNLQKRTTQEKEELYKYASQKTIEALLPAIDNFDYAKVLLNSDSSTEKLIQDFGLVYESLAKSLKEIGLESIDETGILFDPFLHEALHQVVTNELPEHTIIQVLKRGYKLNKKVIRPALVTVSTTEKAENKELSKSNDLKSSENTELGEA